MNQDECRELVDSYVEWLRTGLNARSFENGCELTAPFLDRHNDHIQIYATRRNGAIVLSDDGYILSDLRASGLDMNVPSRKAFMQEILNGFGIRRDNDQLVTEASMRNLGQRVHSLLQAMLALNDLYVLAQPRVAKLFGEDVQQFLDDHNVRYNARVKLTGLSGFDQAIDFLIPKSETRPERLLKAISNPKKNTISTFLWALTDTRAARTVPSEAYAFLDDRTGTLTTDVIEALKAWDVHPIPWASREGYVQELAE